MAKNLKKILLAITIIIVISNLTACFKPIEVSDRAFVHAIGIDYINSAFEVSLDFYNTGDIYDLITVTGNTISDALANAEKSQTKRITIGHCKLVIIGKSVSNLTNVLDFFTVANRISPNVQLAFTDEKISDLMAPFDNKSQISDIMALVQNASDLGLTVNTNLVEFYKFSGKNLGIPLPKIERIGNKLAVNGTTFFVNGIKSVDFTPSETKGMRILNNTLIAFTEPIQLMDKNGNVVVDSMKTKLVPTFSDKFLTITAKINIRCRLDDPKISVNEIPMAEDAISKAIIENCDSAIEQANKQKMDIINLNERLQMKENEGYSPLYPTKFKYDFTYNIQL